MSESYDTEIRARLQLITERVAPAHEDVEADFEGLSLHVAKGVFNPARGKSTRKIWHALATLPLHPGERVLEIGTGTGVLSICAWRQTGVAPVAVDIAPEALACATINFQRHNVPVTPRLSDLFSALRDTERFDVVIFNAPTAHPAIAADNPALGTVWDPTLSLKQRFAEEVGRYLDPSAPHARAYMMYAVYQDYDALAPLDFTGYDLHKLFVERDPLSESGVLVMARTPQLKP